MRVIVATLVATILFAGTEAIQLIKRDTPSVIGLNIDRKAILNPIKRDALRRRQTVSQALDNEETLYFANVSLGTPAQELKLHIDTGSSDLWANSESSRICSLRRRPCSESGTYDANSSSTYTFVNNDFNISYVDGSGASGDYVTDTVSIGGKTLENLQFGVGYESTSRQGILGIGYTANEAQVNRGNGRTYPNLPQAMVDNGLIRSNAYSLWLDDLESSTGSILFGGVDTDKYRGELQTLPVEKEFDEYAQFIITLSGMSLNADGRNTSITTDLPTPVILDSGSSLTYLPNDMVTEIYNAVGATYSSRYEAAFANCSLKDSNITMDFTFTSPTISVPIRELLLDGESDGPDNTEDSTSESESTSGSSDGALCIFGIAPAEGSSAVLGDTFLRSAYVVYDLENNEISLAQTNFDATTSRVTEIGTGSDSVPNAAAVTSAVQAQVSQTGGARIAGASATGTSSLGAEETGGAISTRVSYAGVSLTFGVLAFSMA